MAFGSLNKGCVPVFTKAFPMFKTSRLVCFAALALASAVGSAQAQTTVNLPAPGADCVANGNVLRNAIDAAITASPDGGTIINVPEGVYCFDRPWRLDGLTNEAFTGTRTIQGTSITINGVQAAGSTTAANPANLVIRREPSASLPVGVSPNYRLFNVETAGQLFLSNLTLCNGKAGQGGAVRALGGPLAQVGLTNCVVQDNAAFTRGGGLFIQSNGTSALPGLQLTNVRFFRNVAMNGFGGGVSIEGTDSRIESCVFSCNQAMGGDDADGGGLYFNNGGDPGAQTKFFALLSGPAGRSLFTCNSAASEGGGLYINGGTSDPDGVGPAGPIPSEVDFFGNRADFQGGGLYTQATAVEFNGCTFGGLSPTLDCLGATPGPTACGEPAPTCTSIGEANQAPRGGGVMNVTSQAIFRRCKFVGNRAVAPGGGRAGGAGSSGGTNAYIECCFINNIAAEDFDGNTPADSRGGGSDAEFGSPMYNDCLFKGNEAANGGGVSISGQGKDTTTLIYNCQITQNVGSVAGGGVAVLGDASPRILHTTIARNLSARLGSPRPTTSPARFTAGTGVHCGGTLSLPTLINSIVTQNQRGPDDVNGSFSYGYAPAQTDVNFRGATAVKASFSFIDVGTFAQFPDNVPGGIANSNLKGCWKPGTTGANLDDNDPSFESSGVIGMNVHLQCNSPCIDHANYDLSRAIVNFLINLGSVSPVPEARGQRGEVDPIDTTDPTAVAAFIDSFLKDYDDTAATTGNDENCTGLGTGQDRDNTCRPLQCQSDMGADEARTDIVVNTFTDKVVCPGGSQSFTATANCDPPSSPAIPLAFEWFRVDRVTCAETPLAGVPGYTVTTSPDGTSSTLTIASAVAADDAYFRVKVTRGQYLCNGANIFLPTVPLAPLYTSCDPSAGCPLGICQARLYVVNPPTVATTGDKTVCRNGTQCVEFAFAWTVLPTTPQPVTCLINDDPLHPCNTPRVPPVACTPTIAYTYQASPASQAQPFTGRPNAVITCDPDVPGIPDASGVVRVTRNCRVTFTNPADCDSGRYCATIDCNLPANKCQPATACANLCVTPPPTAGGDTGKTVCVSGNQTISLFADFSAPATCATPWCPTPACVRSVSIVKRVAGQPDVELPIGQTGRVSVACSPINTGTRVNCTVTFTGAQPGDCAQYCIVAGCSNLSNNAPCGAVAVDKCGEATWCANLCVLDPLTGSGDPPKTVCRGGTQTIALSMAFPVGDCIYCSPTSCTPSVVVARKRSTDSSFVTLSQTTPRMDTISGQGTSTTSVACQPFDSATRTINCVVTIANANDANCAEYRISGNCSNLPAADKCTGMYTTNLCVALPPTASAPVPEKTVCVGGSQTIDLSATFPLSSCAFCTPTSCTPLVTIVKRPVSGPDVTLPINGTLGNATITCDPFNTTTRTQNCHVSITNASLDDCARYCIRASCSGVDSAKCPTVEACSALCVVPSPVTTSDPDKVVCAGGSQIMNFTATFPRGLCAVSTGCATACTPSAQIIKRLANGSEQVLHSGGHAAVVCDPTTTLPNGDRQINCRVTISNADDTDCANYCIRANCSNLAGTNKCTPIESCTKLCIVPNPTLTIDPAKTVCVNGDQFFNFAVTFPDLSCTAFCPTTPCTGSFQVVKRPSCTATGGEDIPINPTGAAPRVYVTCDPFNTTTRTYNCRLNISDAVAADCAAYVVRAAACPELVAAGKCGYREICTTLCVVPSPTASGDPTQRVCVGGNQTINLQGFFPSPNCTFCPTSPAPCTPYVRVLRRFTDGTEQPLFDPANPPAVVPRVSVTCSPVSNVSGGRAINCTVTITGAQPGDCAAYCLQSTCGNLAEGKCGTAEYCSNLCVLPPPAPGGDEAKYVCKGGNQVITLYADFPVGDCIYCSPDQCTPSVVLKRRPVTGAEVTLPLNGTRTDVSGGTTATTSVTCSPPSGNDRRITCVVSISNANDANCGNYCIQASCGGVPTGKCATREYCTSLCILQAPIAAAETSTACVCIGGCQQIRFTGRFPVPTCNVPGCNADTCDRSITIYKLVDGSRVPLTEGTGSGQYTCDPINASRIVNCRVFIGGPAGAGCTGATLADAGTYCIDVTCGGLADGKCATDTACTDLSVYERPCPSEIPDYKVCVGGELCVPFTFTAPPCCQAAIIIRKNGQPVTLGDPNSPTAKYRVVGSGGTRQLCIRNLANDDDGNYDVCVSCSNLVDEKNCSCCEPFCLDVLTPPQVSVDIRRRSVCVGQPVEFNFCFASDLMLCPPTGQPGPGCISFPNAGGGMPVPVRYVIEKLTDPLATLPPNDSDCGISPAAPTSFTLEPTSGTTQCSNVYRLAIPALQPEQCGIYRLSVEYCGIDPVGLCRTCVYFEIKCGTVNVCLQGRRECPGVPIFLCPRFPDYADCTPDPYVIRPYQFPYDYAAESAIVCADPHARCLTFQWFRQRQGEPSFTPIPLSENPTAQSCCLDLGLADPEDVACYFLRVSTRTDGDCADQAPCDDVDSPTACVEIKPPEECCWCVECCWDNGRRQAVNGNGVLSMKPVHNEFPEIKAAADFYLEQGEFHHIKKFAGSMLIRQNTALPYKAKLTLYEDCDGCPGEMIKMWDLTEYCVVGEPDPTGLQMVDFKYEFPDDKLWLRGGKTYWWSLQGVSEINTPNYEAYWVTSELGHVLGSVPKKMEVGVDEGWRPLDECCIECNELAFCTECDHCKIIYDGGLPESCATAGGTRSEKSVSPARNSRAADNFVTPPAVCPVAADHDECCRPVDWMVCYIEGYIYTNCNSETFTAWLEIYRNDCDNPDWDLTGLPAYRFRADKIEPLDCYATIDGVPNLRLYKVRFCPMGTNDYPMGLYLHGGRNYWLSLSVEDTFNQSQRAYFAWNSDDCTECAIQFGSGQHIAPGRGIVRWTDVNHDFAFTIAAKNVPFDAENPAPVTAPPACPADVNHNGEVSVQDMFDFLAAWFAGCP